MTQNRTTGRGGDRENVGISEYAVVTGGTKLVTSGVGSCLGIVLHDDYNDVPGLIHVMLPTAQESTDSEPAKLVASGVPLVIEAMGGQGRSGRPVAGWGAGGQ